MADFTQRFSEAHVVLGKIDPQSSSAELNSGYVDLSLYQRVAIIIQLGAITATGTVDADVEQATSSGGAGAKNIDGKSLTQVIDTGDNTVYCIEIRPEELDVNNGYRYINLELTPATAAALCSAVIYGIVPRFAPVPTTNYTQIKD